MNGRPYAVMAEFENAASILHAAEKVRQEGFRNWDVFTPFPVHGLDQAESKEKAISPLPKITSTPIN